MKAYATVAAIEDRIKQGTSPTRRHPLKDPENAGSQRLLAIAGNSTALVGTPDTVSAALMDYYDLGVRILSARGYDLIADAHEFGRDVIPLVRAEVARRDTAACVSTAGLRPRLCSSRLAGRHSCTQ